MKTTLKDIVTIQTGVFAKPSKDGEVVYLQARHFNEGGILLESLHPDLMFGDFNEKHLLNVGDILFAANGTKNFATVFQNHYPTSVASTSFFVIRLLDPNILPDYLAWFLNQPDSQQTLKSFARGTSIASISKAVLEELEISIPDLNTQELILKISRLWNMEKELKQQIEGLREKQIQQLIINALN